MAGVFHRSSFRVTGGSIKRLRYSFAGTFAANGKDFRTFDNSAGFDAPQQIYPIQLDLAVQQLLILNILLTQQAIFHF